MLSNWLKVSLLLCVFGFFRELRPSEPFSTEFFIGYRNLTTDDITQILYPLGTYSYMLQLIVVFLVTDLLRWVAFASVCVWSSHDFLINFIDLARTPVAINRNRFRIIIKFLFFSLFFFYRFSKFETRSQVQASYYIVGVMRLYGVRADAMDGWVRWAHIGPNILWNIHGHRSGVLHVYLCESRAQQIPNGHRAHAIGDIGRTIFGRRFCTSADHLSVDEL